MGEKVAFEHNGRIAKFSDVRSLEIQSLAIEGNFRQSFVQALLPVRESFVQCGRQGQTKPITQTVGASVRRASSLILNAFINKGQNL